jgi:CTP synthase
LRLAAFGDTGVVGCCLNSHRPTTQFSRGRLFASFFSPPLFNFRKIPFSFALENAFPIPNLSPLPTHSSSNFGGQFQTMTRRYVFVVGGVCSGLGKGVTASSLGRLLKCRGFSVTMQKFDPYLNIDPGTMNPCQHGEVFVTDDGAETDLDLGHYERFIDESLTRRSNVTSGQIYQSILEKERRGCFGGGTVQVIPHVTNEITGRIVQDRPRPGENAVTIVEVGGTVGDIESQPFFEAIRQFQRSVGNRNAVMILVTLIPFLQVSQEVKTKPAQLAVSQLQMVGLSPDILVCRTKQPLSPEVKAKLSLFGNVPEKHVIENIDLEFLYELPLALEREGIAQAVCECWGIEPIEADLRDWEGLVSILRNPTVTVTIALVGKYLALHDSYLSVVEALKHGGMKHHASVKIMWVDSDGICAGNVSEKLSGANGVIVPGGFGNRGCDGMIHAIAHARTHDLPYLGICLGMQLAVVEFARNVMGLEGADSTEFDPQTPHPVIDILRDKADVTDLGGTLRKGAYDCILTPGTKAVKLYGKDHISERHRHRFEVNNAYLQEFAAHGIVLSGLSPDKKIVEMIEVADHPYFVGTQAHPEFKSRPNRPHPLFSGLIESSLRY